MPFLDSRFQSSPGLIAGRYYPASRYAQQEYQVSILARLNSRALRDDLVRRAITPPVSILARLNSRALHDIGKWYADRLLGFQSSPGLIAGRYQGKNAAGPSATGFNPRPA